MKKKFLVSLLFVSICKGVITEETIREKTILGALCPLACIGCGVLNEAVDETVRMERRLTDSEPSMIFKATTMIGASHCGVDCCFICGTAGCECVSGCLDFGIKSCADPVIGVVKNLIGAIFNCSFTYNKNVVTKEEKKEENK